MGAEILNASASFPKVFPQMSDIAQLQKVLLAGILST
jgi:hypothetical protein